MVHVVTREHHLPPLGLPSILVDALPCDLQLLSWQIQLKPPRGSNAGLRAGMTPPTRISCEDGSSHQLQGCHVPSQVPCCLREESGQAAPATTATLCHLMFLSVGIAHGPCFEMHGHRGRWLPSGTLSLNGTCLYRGRFLS